MLGGWGVAGPQYTTYADAVASTNGGTDQVVRVQLTLDSGWKSDQRANVSNVTVNDNTWVPKTTETTTTTTTDGPGVKTCDLPAAELRWAKNDATPTAAGSTRRRASSPRTRVSSTVRWTASTSTTSTSPASADKGRTRSGFVSTA